MNLKALRQRNAELRAERARVMRERAAVGNTAVAEKRALTDEERASFVALGAQLEQVEAHLAENAEMLAAAEAAAKAEREWRGESTNADAEVVERNERASGIEVGSDRSESDPKRGFRSPTEFLASVMSAGQGRQMDERLRPLRQRATAGSDEAGEYSNPVGGFLIPEGFSPNLLSLEPEADPIGAMTTKIPMSTSVVGIPARVDKNHASSVSGGLTVTRREETAAAISSRQTFELVQLHAYSLFGLSFATEEILRDSPISFAALLAAGFSSEFTSKLISERIEGTGVGEFLGVLNASCTVTVAKESGQAADTIVFDNVAKMRSRCYGYNKAVWIANHDTMPQLMKMSLAVGTGGAPVYMPSAQLDVPDLLFGRPIYYSEYAKTVGDKGDIILANWSEYLEGMLQPMESAESIHVRFVEHERAFKFWLRNAGTPWWKTALTPKNGSNTLSPFVVLAARA